MTLFAGSGVSPVVDQLSRDPESLARTFAARAARRRPPQAGRRLRRAAGRLARARPRAARGGLGPRPAARRARAAAAARAGRAAGGERAGSPRACRPGSTRRPLPKFRPGGLLVAHAGGDAGMFSAVIGGWVGGAAGSTPVTVPVRGGLMARTLLDPTVRARPRGARGQPPAGLARRACTVGLLDISKARGDVFARPARGAAAGRRRADAGATASRRSPSRRRSTCGTRSRPSARW